MTTPAASSAADLVPLEERLRWLWVFRVDRRRDARRLRALGGPLRVPLLTVALGRTVGYLALQVVLDLVWRAGRGRQLRLFGAGARRRRRSTSAWVGFVAAGEPMPLRYLSLVHLVVVALLASYRTGIRLALWHSALALLALPRPRGQRPRTERWAVAADGATQDLLGFVWLFWLVVLATATFSSVNERELRRRRYDLEALAELSRRVEGASSPPEVVRRAARAAGRRLRPAAHRPAASRRRQLSLSATRGRAESPGGPYVDDPRSVVHRVARTGRTRAPRRPGPRGTPGSRRSCPTPATCCWSHDGRRAAHRDPGRRALVPAGRPRRAPRRRHGGALLRARRAGARERPAARAGARDRASPTASPASPTAGTSTRR